jgi:thiamine kinase-like enzyme
MDEGGRAGLPADLRELESVLAGLNCLAGRSWRAARLPGGLTNLNLKVDTADAYSFVVRISHPDTSLLAIDRDDEYHNSLAAAEAGVGAPVVEYHAGQGVLVVGYIDAATCTRNDIGSPDRLDRIVTACRQLHAGPRFRNHFDMFALREYYLSIVTGKGLRMPDRYLEFEPHVRRIEAALAATATPTVPCHNDLLAENCLDDGRRVWLIDYEYSGNNDSCFELGNLWSESALDLEQLDQIIDGYYGWADPQKVARARLQGLMSKYGWTLWAAIQTSIAEIEFDFWGWGMEKYERAVAEFTGRDFDGLLDAAAGS